LEIYYGAGNLTGHNAEQGNEAYMKVWWFKILQDLTHKGSPCPIILAMVFLLSGCARVGPDFVPPKAQVSPTWLEAGEEKVNTGPASYRNWWRTFNDPVLDRLIDRAYGENLSLRIAGVRVLEARAQLGIFVGELYPQTQQTFGSLERTRLSQGSASSAFTSNPIRYWQSEMGVQASWEIDLWGKFRRAIESANASWLASIADYGSALVSLTADVAASYILIRTLEKRIGIAGQNAEIQKENLKIAEARFRYGSTSQLDVNQAQTVLNNTLASIPALEARLRQAKDALSLLLGSPPSHLTDLLKGPQEIPVSPPFVVVGIPAELVRRRPDIRSAELQAEAQCALIGVAKAALYPAFSLSGTFGFLSTDIGQSKLSGISSWGNRTYQIGPSLQWNVLNYGQITNNVRVQDARFEQLLISYQNTVLKAQQEVEDALVGFLRAQDQAEFLARAAAAARGALDLAVLQYREGTRDFTAVLTAQQALLSEQDSLASTLGNIAGNLVGVYRALGGGWEISEGKELVPPEVREAMAQRTNWGKLLSPAAYNPPASGIPQSLIRVPDW
jgi:NodT family efflux transporter outer membrane factor (OMF) lipoprotein